jgi:hypothetical protein
MQRGQIKLTDTAQTGFNSRKQISSILTSKKIENPTDSSYA